MTDSLAPLLEDLPLFEPGWVWLAGAGPGDKGLLTLHTLNALRQADVVVHDALLGDDIVDLARDGAVLEFAGKRGGRPSPRQRDISIRLIELAQAGKRVLRLKGGDPFVFGRGGEEALALVAAGVPFRIIPGITAAIGGLAYAGIPITHRTTNSAVTFVTGHALTGELPDNLDWPALARSGAVIVAYMAMKHMGLMQEQLLAGGRDPNQPVAIVSDATTPRMRVLETTLANVAQDADRHDMAAPAIIVFGDVVGLRSSMDWLGALNGKELKPQ